MLRKMIFKDASSNRQKSLIETLLGDKDDVDWAWDSAVRNDFVDIVNNNRDVIFHKNYSNGTAIVRGSQPMTNDQYFWEVKMVTSVYGTDMMIGVGTSKVDVTQVHERFVSLLGLDNKTWGLSYTGLFHHNGISKCYASRFGKGSTIGVHLDLWNGTLSFYKNKKYLGIASRGFKGKILYAMASSTAACSGMRIIRTSSFPSSLQFLCCLKLREIIPDDKSVLKVVGLPPGLQDFLENRLGWLLDSRCTENLVYKNVCKKQQLDENTQGCNSEAFSQTLPDACNSGTSVIPNVMLENRNFFSELNTLIENQKLRTGDEEQLNSVSDITNFIREHDSSLEFDEEEDRVEQNKGKRRRFSYNYVMGLSDPDSD